MADNLAQILSGIAALTAKEDIALVMNAVKKKYKKEPYRALTEEENIKLAQGNDEAMILKNKKLYDYSNVAKGQRDKAYKWFKAFKPATRAWGKYQSAYYYWRVWNWPNHPLYKGKLIIVRATGLPYVAPPVAADDEEVDDEEVDDEEVDDEEVDDEEVDDEEVDDEEVDVPEAGVDEVDDDVAKEMLKLKMS
jgi:hypothetical protein